MTNNDYLKFGILYSYPSRTQIASGNIPQRNSMNNIQAGQFDQIENQINDERNIDLGEIEIVPTLEGV